MHLCFQSCGIDLLPTVLHLNFTLLLYFWTCNRYYSVAIQLPWTKEKVLSTVPEGIIVASSIIGWIRVPVYVWTEHKLKMYVCFEQPQQLVFDDTQQGSCWSESIPFQGMRWSRECKMWIIVLRICQGLGDDGIFATVWS